MNLQEKIEKGVNYIIEQSEQKLSSLGSIEKGVFKPTDPKAFKKHKSQIEFRLKFSQAVEELLKQHILLSDGLLEFINRIDGDGNVLPEDLDGLKKFAEKYKNI